MLREIRLEVLRLTQVSIDIASQRFKKMTESSDRSTNPIQGLSTLLEAINSASDAIAEQATQRWLLWRPTASLSRFSDAK